MREIYLTLHDLTPLSRFLGISIMGQRLTPYCSNKVAGVILIEPEYVEPSRTSQILLRWTGTPNGRQRFMEIVNVVKWMAAM